MQLTAEQFNGIIASLRSDPLAGRRGAPRVGLRLRDLSVTGMGFVHSRPFPEGSHLVTRFHQADNESIAILVEVTRCKEVAPKTYEIGTRIDRLITREELGA
jgi:hypothetical protein